MAGTFGERLSELIKMRNYSQKALAMKAGVTEAAMSHYVKGDRYPRASVLARIADALNINQNEYYKALAKSFFISLDNAQGFHPNYPSKYDSTNKCFMNDGVVIKAAARGSYTSDGYSIALFKMLCENSNAKYQFMTNRSDIPGGGTLGAINISHISIPSVDIGFAQVAMHSAMETTGALDIEEMEKVIKYFYSKHLAFKEDGKVVI